MFSWITYVHSFCVAGIGDFHARKTRNRFCAVGGARKAVFALAKTMAFRGKNLFRSFSSERVQALAFSLDTFFWASKRKYQLLEMETDHFTGMKLNFRILFVGTQ